MNWLSALLRKMGLRSATIEPKELSGDDLRALLDVEIRQAFGMSLTEFTAALERGDLDPESPRVAGLAVLVGARAG
jgi:hypothetical protein